MISINKSNIIISSLSNLTFFLTKLSLFFTEKLNERGVNLLKQLRLQLVCLEVRCKKKMNNITLNTLFKLIFSFKYYIIYKLKKKQLNKFTIVKMELAD